jgi:hypothetical protein
LPQRLPPEMVRIAAFADDVSPMRNTCHDDPNTPVPPEAACSFGAKTAPAIAVWGDSHGVELSYALGEMAGETGKSVLELTSSSCSPSLHYSSSTREHCAERNQAVLDYLLATPRIDTVIVAASRFISNDGSPATEKILAGLDEAVGQLKQAGKSVVITYPTPRDRIATPQRLAMQYWREGTIDPDLLPLSSLEAGLRQTLASLDSMVAKYGLDAVRPTEVFCPEADCLAYRDGKVMLFDAHHPSMSAARMVAPLFREIIARSGG